MNKKLNRRRFLRSTSIGVLGVGLFGNKEFATTIKYQKNDLPRKLVYRTSWKDWH